MADVTPDGLTGEIPTSLQLAARLVGCHTSVEVLDFVMSEAALAAVGAHGAALFMLDDQARSVRLERVRAMDLPAREAPVSEVTSPLVARAVREGEISVADDGCEVALPLLSRDRLLGVLLLVLASPIRPGARHFVDLAWVASLLAAVLDGAKAHDEQRQLCTQLQILRAANAAIAERLTIIPEERLRAAVQGGFRLWPGVDDGPLPEFLKPVLQTILDHAKEAAGAEMGALGIDDVRDQPFQPWVYSGVSAAQAAAIGRLPRPVGTLGVVAMEGRVVRTPDVHAHPAFQGLPPHHPDVTSLLGVPIRHRTLNLGNLYLGNKKGSADFTAEDQHIVELLASQAALSLQQAYFRATLDVQRLQLQLILDTAPLGILFVDAGTGRIMANPRARALLGDVRPETTPVECARQVRGRDGKPVAPEALPSTRALAGETISGQEFVVIQPDGHQVPVLLDAAPIRAAGGAVAGAVVTFEDISHLKELERLREEFAAIVAHDLRNPIAAILLQVTVMRGMASTGQVPGSWASNIDRIERNALRLSQMTNDLLDASRVETGRVTLDRKNIDVLEAVRTLIDRLRPTFGRHPVEVEAGAPIPPQALDPLRFDQVLGNLLENAAKFSPDDSKILVRIAARDAGVIVSVEDRGVGIAPDDMPRLFDRFYQSKRAREKKTGLGLGLYITKGIVEAHGGRLWVESQSDRGSTFHVWFPPTTGA